MFEVGFSEIVLILGLALLVLGPEKLPGLAEKVGRWTGRARAMARQLRTQLEQEVSLEELSKSRSVHTPQTDPAHSESEPAASSPPEPAQAAETSPSLRHKFDLDAFATVDTAAAPCVSDNTGPSPVDKVGVDAPPKAQ